jgi:hypothetical protein
MRIWSLILLLFCSVLCESQIRVRVGSAAEVSTASDTIAKIGPQRAITQADNGDYAQSPLAFQTEDGWAYVCTNESNQHTTTGPIKLRRTKDGANWSEPWTVTIAGFDTLGVPSFGTNGNRIFISFQRVFASVPFYNEIFFAHSDDGGQAWTLDDSVGLHQAQVEIFAFGKIAPVRVGRDTIYATGYSNWSQDTSASFFYASYDNGASWQFGNYIMRGLIAGSFPTGGSINETDWIVVEEGATVATTKLLALVRSEKYYGFHYQLYSLDGGATWTNVGVTLGMWFSEENATSGPNTFPVSIISRDEMLYVVYGYRGNNATGLNSSLRVIKGIALDCYDDPTQWSKAYKIYSPTAPIKSFQNDFGYPVPFIINNQLYTTLYDISTKFKSGAGLTQIDTRIITIPLESNNWLEIYDTTTTVAIPTATETTVPTPIVRLDSELAYNVDSTKIYFPYDGWYTVSARVTFEASASGTYRRATLYMVDYGDESGPTPSPMDGKYMITQRSIAPSANAEFNRIELFGQIYAYAGMELRLTVQHDVGSDLELNNSEQNGRATIYFKKSD